MAEIIFLWVFSLAVFIVGALIFFNDKKSLGAILALLGLFVLVVVTFMVVPQDFPSGLPMTSIGVGEYKVAFVYVAGKNVNIGIEKEDRTENNHERLYLYQFTKSAFDDSINSGVSGAKRLFVIESGGFRKLVLE